MSILRSCPVESFENRSRIVRESFEKRREASIYAGEIVRNRLRGIRTILRG